MTTNNTSQILGNVYLSGGVDAELYGKDFDLVLNVAREVTIHGDNVYKVGFDDGFPVPDGVLDKCMKLIKEYDDSGKKVLVNCFAGISRSAGIVICYVAQKYGMSLKEAYDFVASKRDCVFPARAILYSIQKYLKQDGLIPKTW
jgi:protein-tyrosine phosphatase